MIEVNIGYFKNFGTKEVTEVINNLEKENPELKLNLQPLYQDQVVDALDDGEIDFALTDPRDNDFKDYKVIPITEESLVVLLQAGNFMKGEQIVELDELEKIPNILIAKPEEEAGELHYHKDILEIKSPFIAVDSFNEASLMATSGSGYFLMNERTAKLLNNDQLQKMFLLKNGQQLKQKYAVVGNENNISLDFIRKLQDILK